MVDLLMQCLVIYATFKARKSGLYERPLNFDSCNLQRNVETLKRKDTYLWELREENGRFSYVTAAAFCKFNVRLPTKAYYPMSI